MGNIKKIFEWKLKLKDHKYQPNGLYSSKEIRSIISLMKNNDIIKRIK